MFINFKVVDKFLKEFKIEDLFFILAVKQQDQENIQEYYSLNSSQRLLGLGYLKQIKNGELRLDKKGTEFLRDLGKSDEISEDTKKISQWVYETFKNREGGIIKSKPELQRRLQWFSDQTGYQQNKLAIVIGLFITNTYSKDSGLTVEEFMKDNPHGVLNNIAENLFWTPPNHFAKNYTIDNSPLARFIEDNQEYVEQAWREKGIEI